MARLPSPPARPNGRPEWPTLLAETTARQIATATFVAHRAGSRGGDSAPASACPTAAGSFCPEVARVVRGKEPVS